MGAVSHQPGPSPQAEQGVQPFAGSPAAVDVVDLIMLVEGDGLHAVGEGPIQHSDACRQTQWTWLKRIKASCANSAHEFLGGFTGGTLALPA